SFVLYIQPPPSSTLFPYTTLFRSSNCYQHRDMALRFCPQVLEPPFVNGGIVALHGEFLTAETLRAMVREALADPNDGAFEQTIIDRKSTRLNSSHDQISYAVFCLK